MRGLWRRALLLLLTGTVPAAAGAATGRMPIAPVLLQTVQQQGIDAAVHQYHEMRGQRGRWNTSEPQLRIVAYRLLNERRISDALTLLQLNALTFPRSTVARESLADAYATVGEYMAASREYRRALWGLDIDMSLTPQGKRVLRRHIGTQLARIRLYPLFEPLVGVYRAAGDRVFSVTVVESSFGRVPPSLRLVDLSSGAIRTLYRVSGGEFASGGGQAVRFPVEMRVRFSAEPGERASSFELRDAKGTLFAARDPRVEHEHIGFRDRSLELGGVLSKPPGDGPFPGVVLLHGSGNMTRDMPGLGELANYLVLRGFAVLRYDKRGAAESFAPGEPGQDISVLADDAVSAARYLRSRTDIDAARVGFLGFSEGAWVAGMAAVRIQNPAFVVLVSGGGVAPWKQESYRIRAELQADGFSRGEIEEAAAFMRTKFAVADGTAPWSDFQKAVGKARTRDWFPAYTGSWPSQKVAEVAWRNTLVYDPGPVLARLNCPVLALFGDLDRLTPVDDTIAAIRSVRSGGAGGDLTVQVFPRANHCLIEARTGSMRSSGEFASLQGYVPGYFETLGAWLGERLGTDETHRSGTADCDITPAR